LDPLCQISIGIKGFTWKFCSG